MDKNHFHFKYKQQLISALSFYPIGSIVELNTGVSAEVVGINENQLLRPIVRIVDDNNGSTDEIVDLLKAPMLNILKVTA
ncbi:hypothetical protein JW960_11045 [candidate division KSB1 bacterium]|nr:hypothetical protein [candidate division KSB1 bacterium]